MAYASNTEIQTFSTIGAVTSASNTLLTKWSNKAKYILDAYCKTNFDYEAATDKVIYATGPIIPLAKEVNNITSATATLDDGTSDVAILITNEFVVYPNDKRLLKWSRLNTTSSPPAPRMLTLTADWGPAVLYPDVKFVFMTLVERIAIREKEDNLIQMHEPYASQSAVDGYTYDTSSAVMRSYFTPEEKMILHPYIYRGKVVA